MKKQMTNKMGISLIVLVITIIVMIILAAAVVITLSNSGIISKANDTVDVTDLANVQDLATMIWADVYLDLKSNGEVDVDVLRSEVLAKLGDEVPNYASKYDVNVTLAGVTVTKVPEITTTLGDFVVDAENYGDEVIYTVTLNEGTTDEITIDDWKVFYKQTVDEEEYIYLITSEKIVNEAIPKILESAVEDGGSGAIIDGQNIYWDSGSAPGEAAGIKRPTLWLAEWKNYNEYGNGRIVSYFLDETYWDAFKNTKKYGDYYVVGAIGTPTAEMFVASWNAKREATNDTTKYNKKLALKKGTLGYYINNITDGDSAETDEFTQTISVDGELYIYSADTGMAYWLASPSIGGGNWLIRATYARKRGGISNGQHSDKLQGLRPVVCLRASIPAYEQIDGENRLIVLATK